MITVVPVETPGLGDRGYLVHDGEVALVVDPQRDIDRVLGLADEGRGADHPRRSRPTSTTTTSPAGSRWPGDRGGLPASTRTIRSASTGRRPDGDDVGGRRRMPMRVLHTPGHTHTHLSSRSGGGPAGRGVHRRVAAAGSTGRPDLLGPDHTDDLVHAQWRSARRLADALPDDAAVYPRTGSAASARRPSAVATAPTIGQERRANPVLTHDEEATSRSCWPGSTRTPPTTRTWRRPTSPARPRPTCRRRRWPIRPSCGRRIEAGEWVVDLRAGPRSRPGTSPAG